MITSSDTDHAAPLFEQQRLHGQWNSTEKPYPFSKCIHTLFEDQVERSPASIALKYGGTQLTYAELNHQANQLAWRLRQSGVKAESLVGVCLNRSMQMIVAVLAVLKAGGAYVPLDPAFPRERLDFMVEDADLSFIVTEPNLSSLFQFEIEHIFYLDQEHALPQKSGNLADNLPSTALAYVIYTSGSTGQPKGVQITHSSVVNLLYSIAELTDFDSTESILGLTTISFDIAALEIFLPLIKGANLVVVPREIASDGMLLADLVKSSGVTVIQGTPTTWKMLLQGGWTGDEHLKVFCGGEALQPELARKLSSSSQVVWNLYGPTETTVWSTAWKVLPDQPVSVGRPIANTQIHILDSKMHPVAPGVTGELFIGGHGLARGYLNRPDLNREKFVRNSFSKEQDDYIYRTGDLAQYLPDGNIILLGRIDDQVKIRGHRIELGEIESCLLKHPAINEAVITACLDATVENTTLAAYIVLYPASSVATTELRDFLKHKLPAFMVPSTFVFLKRLPLTPNGKVNRRALPPPSAVRSSEEEFHTAPRTPIEQALVDIWTEVLRKEKISVHDTLIDLGGHSLSALQVVARIHQRFDVVIPVQALLDGFTIARIGESLFTTLLKRSNDEELKRLSATP